MRNDGFSIQKKEIKDSDKQIFHVMVPRKLDKKGFVAGKDEL